jgi:hypothetical protein
MGLNLSLADPAVAAAIVTAVGSILTTLAAGTGALLINRQITRRRRLQAKLDQAQKDIAFMLAVEHQHCQVHQDRDGQSLKLIVRERVRDAGLQWSGRFTPGRVRRDDQDFADSR